MYVPLKMNKTKSIWKTMREREKKGNRTYNEKQFYK